MLIEAWCFKFTLHCFSTSMVTWTAQSIVGKLIATKQYDLINEQLYELLDSHGVLPELVRINWNLSNDPEKQGIYLEKNYKYSPITDQAYK